MEYRIPVSIIFSEQLTMESSSCHKYKIWNFRISSLIISCDSFLLCQASILVSAHVCPSILLVEKGEYDSKLEKRPTKKDYRPDKMPGASRHQYGLQPASTFSQDSQKIFHYLFSNKDNPYHIHI